MSDPLCPNYSACQLVNGTIELLDKRKELYINLFCKDLSGKWQACKRFTTKKELNFCPDFVLPDTTLSTEEIIEKFDST